MFSALEIRAGDYSLIKTKFDHIVVTRILDRHGLMGTLMAITPEPVAKPRQYFTCLWASTKAITEPKIKKIEDGVFLKNRYKFFNLEYI